MQETASQLFFKDSLQIKQDDLGIFFECPHVKR